MTSTHGHSWTGAGNVQADYTTDGQNKYTNIAGATKGCDAKGNLSTSGSLSLTFDAESRLATGAEYSFYRDPLVRLALSTYAGNFDFGGSQLNEQTDAYGSLYRRYVFGADRGKPVVWYEGAGTANRRYMDADGRGSIIRVTNASGATLRINTYDEFGVPGPANLGRFQFDGQVFLRNEPLPFRGRLYSPAFGRFVEPDATGQNNGLSPYDVAHGDLGNGIDAPEVQTYWSRCSPCDLPPLSDSSSAG